jgi:hypothetical protein
VNGRKNGKPSKRAKKSSKSKKLKTLPEINYPKHSQCKLSPLGRPIMFLLSTTQLAKSSTNFVLILFPFGNELIKHKPREEREAMHEIQI